MAATRTGASRAELDEAAHRDTLRSRAESEEELQACDARASFTPTQPLPELCDADVQLDTTTLKHASPRLQCCESAGAGRGLHACVPLPAGAALLCEPPFVLAVHKPQRTSRCHACLARLPRDLTPMVLRPLLMPDLYPSR